MSNAGPDDLVATIIIIIIIPLLMIYVPFISVFLTLLFPSSRWVSVPSWKSR